jgi:hypothetical protein
VHLLPSKQRASAGASGHCALVACAEIDAKGGNAARVHVYRVDVKSCERVSGIACVVLMRVRSDVDDRRDVQIATRACWCAIARLHATRQIPPRTHDAVFVQSRCAIALCDVLLTSTQATFDESAKASSDTGEKAIKGGLFRKPDNEVCVVLCCVLCDP